VERQPQSPPQLKVVREHSRRTATVAFLGDDVAFLAALRAGDPAATAALYDAHHRSVLTVLARILGADSELGDILHDVFVRALRGVRSVRDTQLLAPWLRQIAVCTAMDCLRRRSRRRWLRYVAPDELTEPAIVPANSEAREAMRRVYRILDAFPPEERVAFSLRVLAGLELTAVAAAANCSLATIKRRLGRAEQRFAAQAQQDEVLAQWLAEGNRWELP
jgi:RNA polymerase sigma-70 factor (ECF subfamily)